MDDDDDLERELERELAEEEAELERELEEELAEGEADAKAGGEPCSAVTTRAATKMQGEPGSVCEQVLCALSQLPPAHEVAEPTVVLNLSSYGSAVQSVLKMQSGRLMAVLRLIWALYKRMSVRERAQAVPAHVNRCVQAQDAQCKPLR